MCAVQTPRTFLHPRLSTVSQSQCTALHQAPTFTRQDAIHSKSLNTAHQHNYTSTASATEHQALVVVFAGSGSQQRPCMQQQHCGAVPGLSGSRCSPVNGSVVATRAPRGGWLAALPELNPIKISSASEALTVAQAGTGQAISPVSSACSRACGYPGAR